MGGQTDTARDAVGWVGEKAGRLTLRLDDASGENFRRQEATELVAVGIEGKRSLWAALAGGSACTPTLRGPDYPRLIERAAEQRRRNEPVRLVPLCHFRVAA